MARHPAPQDDPAQSQRFLDLAKELGATNPGKDLAEAVRAVATHPRVDRKDKTGAKKRDAAK